MQSLKITGLKTKTKIGIHAFEQQILQSIILDIEIPLDLPQDITNIEQTVDYAKVCDVVTHFIESNQFDLIEKLSQQVRQLLQTEFKLTQFTLTVSKPNAIANAANISFHSKG